MTTIRSATQDDKSQILSFCTNTFSWGDYIDHVWDLWLHDESGRMLVAESGGIQVGVSHVSLCPDSGIWLEGVRVHPSFRRTKIATELIGEMLKYGVKYGATSAQAIVARDNVASQKMMERSGFSVISEWSYHSTGDRATRQLSTAKLACSEDLDSIMLYLEGSKIYAKSAKKYVKSWHWYTLDRLAIYDFVKKGSIVISGEPIGGLAVINRGGYWNRRNVLQVVYLDSEDPQILYDLLAYAANLYSDGGYERMHVLCQNDKQMIPAVERFQIQESEQFFLYSKVFSG